MAHNQEVAGSNPAPATWTTACPDWTQRIVERRSLVPFDPLFPDEAEAALSVFKSLRLVDVVGQPTFGEACDEWVFDWVRAIFGAFDVRTNRQMIRESLLLISKKNGKSTVAAAIMLTALIRNRRYGAEALLLAPTKEVANNAFTPASEMVRADAELSELLHVVDHQRTIKHRTRATELKVVAADSDIVSGKKASYVYIDELWLFGKRAGAEAMLREATGGQVSRPEGFVLYSTTHSDEAPAGVYKARLDYARDVRDGVIEDPKFLPVLYEWPEPMAEAQAYLEPKNFYVTNPNLGRSVDQDWLASELIKEQRGEGEGLQIFLAKHLNVEIGLRLRRDRWRGADLWDDCKLAELAGPGLEGLDWLLSRCEVVVAGVDGGGLDDLLGLCVAGREKGGKRWLYWFRAWAWAEVLERRKEIAPTLKDFAADGDLVILEAQKFDADALDESFAPDEDVTQLVALLSHVKASGLLPESSAIGLDPAGVGVLVDALAAAGFTVAEGSKGEVVAISQGWGLASAIYSMERKLNHRTMAHSGSKMMDWCVSNAKAELKGKNVYIHKSSAGKAKIDPLIAGFNATKLLETNPEAADGNVDAWLASMRPPSAAAAA